MSGSNVSFDPKPVVPAKKMWGQAAVLTAVVGYVSYAVLWSVMWVPVLTGNETLLALYPIYILMWLPIEVLVLVSLVLSVITLSIERSMLAGTLAVLALDLIFLVLSLPTLWYGEFPWYVFVPS